LQRAFFEPSSVGKYGCSGIALSDCFPSFSCYGSQPHHQLNSALDMSHIQDVKPEYICNLLVGNWVKDPCKENCESYSLLSVTPNTIERIDGKPDENTFDGRYTPNSKHEH
jgi:hypothetical protein